MPIDLASPERPAPRPAAAALALALLPLTACGGGGGGGGAREVEQPLDQGSFTIEDFDYDDDRPEGYHPLGFESVNLTRRTELALSIPGNRTWFRAVEDPGQGGALVAGSAAALADTAEVFGHAAARLDGDAEEELVTLERVSGAALRLWRTDHVGAAPSTALLADLAHGGWQIAAASLAVGDVDRDGLDEVVVIGREAITSSSFRARVWVLDDPLAGGLPLLDEVFTVDNSAPASGPSATRPGLGVVFGDFDPDGAVRALLVGERGSCKELRWDAAQHALTFEGGTSLWRGLENGSYLPRGTAVAGDFDGDGVTDVAHCGQWGVRMYRRTGPSTWSLLSLVNFGGAGDTGATPPATGYAIDRRTDGVAVYLWAGWGWILHEAWYDPGSPFDMGTRWVAAGLPGYATWSALAVSDADADGQDELELLLFQDAGTSAGARPRLALGRLELGPGQAVDWYHQEQWPAGVHGTTREPSLTAGDWDADGMTLTFTGRSEPRLFDPIPLVVMCAPPVKLGIGQNLDDSEVAFETGQSSGQTWGVTTGVTATASVGAGFEIGDLFGAEARATLESSFERSRETTERIHLVQGHRGAADADVVLFQGTLYMSYEYEVTRALDPAATGQLITLDFPVAEKLYKWTVPYYNTVVDPAFRVDPEVLAHTPGDPSTYPSRAELLGLVGDDMRWLVPGALPVGQGSGSSYQRIEFEQEISDVSQTTWSYGGSVSSTTAGISLETSTAWSEGTIYGVTQSSTSVFEAAVGDIADPALYQDWNYDWGLVVQTVGRRADAGTNLPLDLVPDRRCYQVIRYWVETTGGAW